MNQSTHTHSYPDDAAKAKHLAFLLAQSVMPQEQKEAWINVLPVMLPEQVDTLICALEREHHGYVEASESLVNDLKRLESELQQQLNSLKAEELKAIETFIKKQLTQTKA